MDFFLKVMDSIVMQVVWICYVIRHSWISKGDKPTHQLPAICHFQDEDQNQRHFIHLYTTSQDGGRPVCYMDVYKMTSPSDEQKLRDVCSKGVPNKTYLRYRRRQRSKTLPQYKAEDWREYSTMAL